MDTCGSADESSIVASLVSLGQAPSRKLNFQFRSLHHDHVDHVPYVTKAKGFLMRSLMHALKTHSDGSRAGHGYGNSKDGFKELLSTGMPEASDFLAWEERTGNR